MQAGYCPLYELAVIKQVWRIAVAYNIIYLLVVIASKLPFGTVARSKRPSFFLRVSRTLMSLVLCVPLTILLYMMLIVSGSQQR